MEHPDEKPLVFNDLGDLEDFLRTFTTLHRDSHQYDRGALFGMLLACLDNLEKFGILGDFQSLGDYMTEKQRSFFLVLAEHIRNYRETDE